MATLWTILLTTAGLLAGQTSPDPHQHNGRHVDQHPGQVGPADAGAPEDDVLAFEMDRITGETESLETYRGKVVLIVNVASKCGYTPQYEGLEALYREYKDEGLVILGFPANDFGGQEPGTDEQILEFCQSRYDVTFPMFSKIKVTGDDAHPLYATLADQPEPIGGQPRWNFTKFLLNREGRVVNRYEPGVRPSDDKLRQRIEALIADG